MAQESITGWQAYTILNTSTYTVVVFSNYAKCYFEKCFYSLPHIAIPKTLLDQFLCQFVMSLTKFVITTANSTNTYKLGNINPVCWLRNVRAHVCNIKNIPYNIPYFLE